MTIFRRRAWSTSLGIAIVCAAAWAAVRIGGVDHGFPAVQLIAFTPYVAAGALVVLAAALISRRWRLGAAAALVVAALATCVVPRALPDQDTQPAAGRGPRLRVLTANLLLGGADAERVVGLVRTHRVDLLALQEYTAQAAQALDAAGLAELLPHRVAHPLGGAGGSALYSRLPLNHQDPRVNPSGFLQARATLSVPGATALQVESVHPHSPADQLRTGAWAVDLGGQPAATPRGPVRLLLGDFNATLDHAALRALLATGYRDAADVVGAGLQPTWPYDDRPLPKVTIDHVLVDRRVSVAEVSQHTVAQSDHRAVYAEVVLPAG